MKLYKIQDWAGNVMSVNNSVITFLSFEEAEYRLSYYLGEDYDTDRQEYVIVEE